MISETATPETAVKTAFTNHGRLDDPPKFGEEVGEEVKGRSSKSQHTDEQLPEKKERRVIVRPQPASPAKVAVVVRACEDRSPE
jgi:hypothetical protein